MNLAHITALTGKGMKFDWIPKYENAFNEMKAIMANHTLVSLSHYGQEFTIHTDASDE